MVLLRTNMDAKFVNVQVSDWVSVKITASSSAPTQKAVYVVSALAIVCYSFYFWLIRSFTDPT